MNYRNENGQFGFIRITKLLYKRVKILNADEESVRIYSQSEVKTVKPADIHLESMLAPTANEGRTRRPSQRSLYLKRKDAIFAPIYPNAHVFAFGKVIKKQNDSEKVLIQFFQGPAKFVNKKSIINDETVIGNIEGLAPLNEPKLLKYVSNNYVRTLFFGTALEIALTVFLFSITPLNLSGASVDNSIVNGLQLLFSSVSLFLSLRSLHFLYGISYNTDGCLSWQVTLKTVQFMVCDTMNIFKPTPERAVIIIILIIIRIIQLGILWYVIPSGNIDGWEMFKGRMVAFDSRDTFEEDFIESNAIIQSPPRYGFVTQRTPFHFKYFVALGVGLIAFFILILACDTGRIFTNQSPFFTESEISAIKSRIPYRDNNTRPFKVILVLLDGMRKDYMSSNSEFKTFLDDVRIKRDGLVFPMKSNLPSMSVPNWASIITGAPPMMTGILGNLAAAASLFDNIFVVANSLERKTGITGTDWFQSLIQGFILPNSSSSLSSVMSGVYSSTSFYGSTSQDFSIADKQREEVLMSVLNGETTELDFFLAHFSNIDQIGHTKGVSKRYNKDDSYDGEVTVKAKLLKNVIDKMDNNTILFVASDHGHVDAGGHGGTDPNLWNVALVAYGPGSNLSAYQNEVTEISNLDISSTICSLIGIPPPATSFGTPIEPLLRLLNDTEYKKAKARWVNQQEVLAENFMIRLGSQYKDLPNNSTFGFLTSPIIDLKTLNYVSEAFFNSYGSLSNGVILFWILLVNYVVLLEYFACATPLNSSIVRFVLSARRRDELFKNSRKELFTIALGFIYFSIYFVVAISVYLLFWVSWGYTSHIFESTVLHYPYIAFIGFGVTIIPGILLELSLVKLSIYFCYVYIGLDFSQERSFFPSFVKKYASLFCCVFHPFLKLHSKSTYLDYHQKKFEAKILVTRIHLVTFTFAVVTAYILLLSYSSTSGILFFFRQVFYINAKTWNLRYQCLTILWMLIPLLFSKIIGISVTLHSLMYAPVAFE
jgi:hypothetical protein